MGTIQFAFFQEFKVRVLSHPAERLGIENDTYGRPKVLSKFTKYNAVGPSQGSRQSEYSVQHVVHALLADEAQEQYLLL